MRVVLTSYDDFPVHQASLPIALSATSDANHYDREQYGYEKQMLDDWFRKDVLPK